MFIKTQSSHTANFFNTEAEEFETGYWSILILICWWFLLWMVKGSTGLKIQHVMCELLSLFEFKKAFLMTPSECSVTALCYTTGSRNDKDWRINFDKASKIKFSLSLFMLCFFFFSIQGPLSADTRFFCSFLCAMKFKISPRPFRAAFRARGLIQAFIESNTENNKCFLWADRGRTELFVRLCECMAVLLYIKQAIAGLNKKHINFPRLPWHKWT